MTNLYWVLGGGAALIAGGLAAGAWESLRKRLFRDFGGLLLNAYTFGTKSLETKLFRHVAMRPKKDVTFLVLFFLITVVGIGVVQHWLEALVSTSTAPVLRLGAFMALILIIGHPLLKTLYCEFYTLRFDYYMALARPYLTELEFHLYNARFAGIETKQQHMELCDEVKLVGRQRKLATHVPAGEHSQSDKPNESYSNQLGRV